MKDQARGVLQRITVGHLVNVLVVIAIIAILVALLGGVWPASRESSSRYIPQYRQLNVPDFRASAPREPHLKKPNQRFVVIKVSQLSEQIVIQVMLIELVPDDAPLHWEEQPMSTF